VSLIPVLFLFVFSLFCIWLRFYWKGMVAKRVREIDREARRESNHSPVWPASKWDNKEAEAAAEAERAYSTWACQIQGRLHLPLFWSARGLDARLVVGRQKAMRAHNGGQGIVG